MLLLSQQASESTADGLALTRVVIPESHCEAAAYGLPVRAMLVGLHQEPHHVHQKNLSRRSQRASRL